MEVRYKLIGASGRFAGCEFGVGPGIHQIGRHSSNQVVLAGDGSVSRNHARLTVSSAGVTLQDLKSTNGTYINGKKIVRQAVNEGDTLRFGDAAFTFEKASEFPSAMRVPCPEPGCSGTITSGTCAVCGRRPLICPQCGTRNAADARFCRSDGIPISPQFGNAPRGPGATGPLLNNRSPAGIAVTGARTNVTGRAAVAPEHPNPAGRPAESPAPDHRMIERLNARVLENLDFPRCVYCGANVGKQAELCPKCHARIRRCAAGHVSPASARGCVRCGKELLPVVERWGVFRGAASSGWTPEAVRPPLRLAWKLKSPESGSGWTSPVLGGGVVFAGSSDGFVYALSGGVALWRTPLDGPLRTGFTPESCAPAYDDGRVYIGHMAEAIVALDAREGSLIWQRDLPGRPSSPLRPARGHLFFGVYMASGEGAICSLDQNGEETWRCAIPSPVYSCPAYSGGAILAATAGGAVLALDAENGQLLWEHVEHGDEFNTSVAVAREGVYATSRAGKLICLDPRSGEVLRRWTSPTGNYAHSSPAVGSGGAEGMVFFGADDRQIYVVSAQTARTIASHPTGGVVLGSPAISDDLAYVGSQDGRLYVVGPRPHSIESAYRLSDNVSVASSPAVGDGQVIFAASDGCLYALESCARVEE